jgi:hypothetical protein
VQASGLCRYPHILWISMWSGKESIVTFAGYGVDQNVTSGNRQSHP